MEDWRHGTEILTDGQSEDCHYKLEIVLQRGPYVAAAISDFQRFWPDAAISDFQRFWPATAISLTLKVYFLVVNMQ